MILSTIIIFHFYVHKIELNSSETIRVSVKSGLESALIYETVNVLLALIVVTQHNWK